MLDAKLDIRELTNKSGKPYKMLDIYIKNPQTNEFLMVHTVYMHDTLTTILSIIKDLEKNTVVK
jgi:hypothetical protein